MILPITRSWLDSRAAQRVYLVCAVLSLALFGTLVGTRTAQDVAGRNALPPATLAVLRVVFVPETIAAAVLWAGMLYFWFNLDRSNWLKRALWFPFILCFIFPAPPLYYFLVYRKETRSLADPQHRPLSVESEG
jgi:hypothetical protein